MLSSIKQRIDREDEGFTLIELMVVVLIIAILLAIAIPTFLGARNAANARGAQSNLRNGLTAEQTWWTNNQVFSADTSAAGMKGMEGALNWVTVAPVANNDVSVAVGAFGGPTGSAVQLQAQGKDNNCYVLLQNNDPAASSTAYGYYKGACGAPAAPTGTAPAVTTGKAVQSATAATLAYYTSW